MDVAFSVRSTADAGIAGEEVEDRDLTSNLTSKRREDSTIGCTEYFQSSTLTTWPAQ